MKERISITIDRDLVKTVDSKVDGHKIKNRSHAIELLLARALKVHVPRKAVILAGGQGTRLRPLTYEIPKALIPVQGKTLTEHLFDLFKKYGIIEIILSVGHMSDKIKEYFGNGNKFGLNITYLEEKQSLGTAGPLKLGKYILTETFICTN